jgi:hypothetical protein
MICARVQLGSSGPVKEPVSDLALFSLWLVSHEITLRGGRVSGEAERRCGWRPTSGAASLREAEVRRQRH